MKRRIKSLDKYGSWALVLGASEGLGAAFAERLAMNGKDLILVSNDEVNLQSTAEDLRVDYTVQIREMVLDLSKSSSMEELRKVLLETNCSLVIFNAAYGPVKRFLTNTSEELDYYIDLNCRAPIQLAHIFAELRLGKESSGFLLMSSLAGLRGTLLVSPYAASKAFDWNLMEGLFYEFRDTNLDFTSCCAGPIATPGYLSTNPRNTFFTPKPADPIDVASDALSVLGKKAVWIEGRSNRLTNIIMSRLLPHSWASTIANNTMKSMYEKQWGSGY